jgi:RNA polymerase sigma-70 factor (ECF subfamily)
MSDADSPHADLRNGAGAWTAPSAVVSEGSASSIDAAGIAQLYEKYAPAIYAHCRRLLGSTAAARDAMQEAFVRVLLRNRNLAPGDEALRYLYRTATNVSINVLRQRAVRDRAVPEIAARAAKTESGEGHADRQFVRMLLDRVDATGGSIAVMHFVDGMTQVEIAATLGITRRTVFNRLKALEKLAKALMSEGEVAPEVDDEGDGTT